MVLVGFVVLDSWIVDASIARTDCPRLGVCVGVVFVVCVFVVFVECLFGKLARAHGGCLGIKSR